MNLLGTFLMWSFMSRKKLSPIKQHNDEDVENLEKEMLVLIEENKGLRKGLQEILEFLKDNSVYFKIIGYIILNRYHYLSL